MRIIIVPQSFKGSLTAKEAGDAIAQGAQAAYPDADITIVPIADGGDGTVEAFVDAKHGEVIYETVTGPLGKPVNAFYGLLDRGHTAVIEVAACAGYLLVPPALRDPRITTTYGVGELILSALDQGCRHLIIGLGSSATNDGGAGMAQALGISMLTSEGQEIKRGGAALATLERISTRNMDARLRECKIECASDVTIPLCGPLGASAIFGPQKGATSEMVAQLDAALEHYAEILERDVGVAVKDIPGAGAAGGLGAGLMAFLQARIHSGAEMVLDAVRFEELVQEADLVITGEGKIDKQTMHGKTVGVVARLAKRQRCPVIVVAGALDESYQAIYSLGVDAVVAVPPRPMTLEYAMEHAAALTSDAVERTLRTMRLRVG